jgi:predicted amidophosphoribosyltransferase
VRCPWCHKDVAAGWALCPDCGSQLEAGLDEGTARAMYRPAGEMVCAARYGRPARPAGHGQATGTALGLLDLLR